MWANITVERFDVKTQQLPSTVQYYWKLWANRIIVSSILK